MKSSQQVSSLRATPQLLLIGFIIISVGMLSACKKEMVDVDEDVARETVPGLDMTEADISEGSPEFSKIINSMKGLDFTATIDISGGEGFEAPGEIYNEYDASGTIRSTVQTPEGDMQVVITEDAFYMKMSGSDSWIKTSNPEIAGMTDMSFSPEEIEEISAKTTLVLRGEGICSAGTCYIYDGESEGTAYELLVDKQTNLVTQMVTVTPEGQTVTVAYVFEDVSIEVPSDALDLAIPEGFEFPAELPEGLGSPAL